MSQEINHNPKERFGGHWVERKPIPVGREFFEFEMQFALEMQRRFKQPLEEIILKATWNLKNRLFIFDKDSSPRLHPRITSSDADFLVEFALEMENLESQGHKPITYHEEYGEQYEKGAQFGCHYYTYPSQLHKDIPTVAFHFTNYAFGDESPLSDTERAFRRLEVRDMLRNIADYHPEATQVAGKSWLYNLPQYCCLFPDSYINSRVIENNPRHWSMGSTIWGQFLDSQSKLKKTRVEGFLSRLKELPTEMSLWDIQGILHQEGLLLLPYVTLGKIDDFYQMYNVGK